MLWASAKEKKNTVPPGQMILPEMQKQLIQLPERSFKTTLTVLTKVLPEFKNYLKNRPESNVEANDLYLIYLQIFHKSMTLFPISKDEVAFYERNQKVIQTMSKYLQFIQTKGWLVEMNLVLFEIYRFLNELDLTQGQQFVNLETIRYLLSKSRTLTLENENGSTFVYLDNNDFFNEFGVEIRKEYFKNTYSKEVFSLKSDI